jgi:HSP20 family protein
MAAGCRPEDLTITITRDMITIKGRREENKTINDDDYFVRELYWGAFSRTILLPQEVEPDSAEAIERHGLLIIRIPKIDKSRKTTLKVKSL